MMHPFLAVLIGADADRVRSSDSIFPCLVRDNVAQFGGTALAIACIGVVRAAFAMQLAERVTAVDALRDGGAATAAAEQPPTVITGHRDAQSGIPYH